MESVYPCGFLVFGEPPGSYEICPVCGWEDDHVQLRFPDMAGGANKASLRDQQEFWLAEIPPSAMEFGKFRRDPVWRPLRPDEGSLNEHTPTSGLDYFHAAAEDSPTYYWLI